MVHGDWRWSRFPNCDWFELVEKAYSLLCEVFGHYMWSCLYDWPLEFRLLLQESTGKTIYYLSIFCMRLLIDLHLQVTNTDSDFTATPGQKLLYSTLRSLFSGLLSCSVQNSFRLDSCTLLNGEKLGLRQSLYFVYVRLLWLSATGLLWYSIASSNQAYTDYSPSTSTHTIGSWNQTCRERQKLENRYN